LTGVAAGRILASPTKEATMTRLVLALALIAGAAGATIITGHQAIVVGSHDDSRSQLQAVGTDQHEVLRNPGFETGSLEPWTGSGWVVDDKFPHTGAYNAVGIGNISIVQWVDTTPCSDIQSVSWWARQPDQPAAQAYSLYYSDNSMEELVVFPTPDWQQFDVTSQLQMNKSLVGIRIWGYSGGGPGPDSTYIDDASIPVPGGIHDCGVAAIIAPSDTLEQGAICQPACRVANYGNGSEVVRTVMTIEDSIDPDPYYCESVDVSVEAGDAAIAHFPPFQTRSATLHHATAWTALESDTNPQNDTLSQLFVVIPGVGFAEQRQFVTGKRAGTSVMSVAALARVVASGREYVVDVTGRTPAEPGPGVYWLVAPDRTRKVVVGR
jgi:hypothetical protein